MAEHAVVNLAQHFPHVHARVGQLEAVAAAQAPVGAEHRFGQGGLGTLDVDEMPVVERFGKAEDDPGAIGAIVQARGAPALQAFDVRLETFGRVAGLLAIHQRAAGAGDRQLEVARCAVVRDGFAVSRATTASSSGVDTTCAPPFNSGSARRRTKSTLKRKRSSCAAVLRRIASRSELDLEQPREKPADVGRHADQQVRERDRRARRVGRPAVRVPLGPRSRGRPPPLPRRSARTRTPDARGRADPRTYSRARRAQRTHRSQENWNSCS